MTTRPFLKTCFATAAGLLALMPSGDAQPPHKAKAHKAAPPPKAAPASAHNWQPNAVLLKQLAPEASLLDYGIRPPQAYQLEQAPTEHDNYTLVTYVWSGEKRPDQTQPSLTILIFSPKPGFHPMNDEEVIGKIQKNIQGRLKDYAQSPVEDGTVHTVPFTRTYWKGTEAKTQEHAHGFTYFASDNFTAIMIIAEDGEPHTTTTLPVLEASVETFRRL